VPELDKLVKLSRLFGITLDELVDGAPPTPAEPSAGTAAPRRAAFPPRKIVGSALLGIACLCVILGALLSGLGEGLILAVPFVLCGAVCFAARRYPGLWCAWALYLLAAVFFTYATGITWRLVFLTPYYEPSMNYLRLATAWVEVLLTLLLICWTAVRFCRPKGPVTRKKRLLLAAGWLGWMLLYLCPGPGLPYGAYVLLNQLLVILLAVLVTATVRVVCSKKSN